MIGDTTQPTGRPRGTRTASAAAGVLGVFLLVAPCGAQVGAGPLASARVAG